MAQPHSWRSGLAVVLNGQDRSHLISVLLIALFSLVMVRLFQGSYGNEGATTDKFREGVYHSGDLGHIVVKDGKHYRIGTDDPQGLAEAVGEALGD